MTEQSKFEGIVGNNASHLEWDMPSALAKNLSKFTKWRIDFRMTHKLGEGTFSEVLKVKHKTNGKIYAMKRFRKRFNSTFEEIQNLREIQALRRLNPHNHVIQLIEVIFDQKHGLLALNFELMDCNLYELISRKSTVMTEAKARNYFFQICKGLDYMHSKGIFHRDIKPENILIKDNTVKLADFGSCRGIHSKQPYTEYIATRWYRSPECLLCDGIYTYKMDVWGAGCVLYEIITKQPLFPGSNELDQLHKIHSVVGTPSQKLLKKMLGSKGLQPEYNFAPKDGTGLESIMPSVSKECLDLLQLMLTYDPDIRITARDTLKHGFFREYFEKVAPLSNISSSQEKINATAPPPQAPSIQHNYIKSKDYANTSKQSVEHGKQHEEKQSFKQYAQQQKNDESETQSVSSNSTVSKGKKDAHPIGMRRRSKKEYKINNYGSKSSLTKLPSLKGDSSKPTQLPLIIDNTKSKSNYAQKEYVTLPSLPSNSKSQKENMGAITIHSNISALPSIHHK